MHKEPDFWPENTKNLVFKQKEQKIAFQSIVKICLYSQFYRAVLKYSCDWLGAITRAIISIFLLLFMISVKYTLCMWAILLFEIQKKILIISQYQRKSKHIEYLHVKMDIRVEAQVSTQHTQKYTCIHLYRDKQTKQCVKWKKTHIKEPIKRELRAE